VIKALPAVVEQLSEHQPHRERDRHADQGLVLDLALDRTETVAARRLDIACNLVQALLSRCVVAEFGSPTPGAWGD
jgi:hypothetical protein